MNTKDNLAVLCCVQIVIQFDINVGMGDLE
jgi:hypothetical protein